MYVIAGGGGKESEIPANHSSETESAGIFVRGGGVKYIN